MKIEPKIQIFFHHRFVFIIFVCLFFSHLLLAGVKQALKNSKATLTSQIDKIENGHHSNVELHDQTCEQQQQIQNDGANSDDDVFGDVDDDSATSLFNNGNEDTAENSNCSNNADMDATTINTAEKESDANDSESDCDSLYSGIVCHIPCLFICFICLLPSVIFFHRLWNIKNLKIPKQ